ncbi:hypothetical protein [Alteromonas lipotrueiana]|uniref:hypothetical protein n=1 Tax=Alteromonas lipotrueiana TaxID=2803815 RepID=UPI001C4444C5|nr:hypothetical protein [Alteromonas lipotrueiana]
MSLLPSITFAKASVLLEQNAGTCVHWVCRSFGMTLFIASLNIVLILCGSLADSTEVVSAIIENPVIGPVTVALLGLLVAYSVMCGSLKSSLLTRLFQRTPARRAGVILRQTRLTLQFFAASHREQLTHGSRAPPLSPG